MSTMTVTNQLRPYCNGAAQISLAATSIRTALLEVEQRFPELHRCICDEAGKVRRHINLFVNTTHYQELAALDSMLGPDDILHVLPAVSGG